MRVIAGTARSLRLKTPEGMDPPYGGDHVQRAFGILRDMPYVTEQTLIVAEASLGEDFSCLGQAGFRVVREKCYKTNKHVFCQRI